MSLVSKTLDYLIRQYRLEEWGNITPLLEQNLEARLLDLGCGDGELTLKVAERIGTKRICGIDIRGDRRDEAKAKGIEVYQVDLNDTLLFESASFDVVLANHIIEHLCNTDGFIREIYRVLKVNGYAIIATPNLAAFYNILSLVLGQQPYNCMVSDEVAAGSWSKLKRYGPWGRDPAHRRVFTLRALKELLEYHGFQVERSISSGYLPFPNPLAKALSFIDKSHATNMVIKARKPDKETI